MKKVADDLMARVVISEYLDKYDGKPILFDMPGEELRDLFFDFDDETDEYVFALSPKFIELIDFSNIPVDKKAVEKVKIKLMEKRNKGE